MPRVTPSSCLDSAPSKPPRVSLKLTATAGVSEEEERGKGGEYSLRKSGGKLRTTRLLFVLRAPQDLLDFDSMST